MSVVVATQVDVPEPSTSPPSGVEGAGRGCHPSPTPRAGVAPARPHEVPRRASSRSTTTASMVSSLAPRSSTSIALPPTIASRRSHSASSEEAALLISSRPCAASRSIWRRRSMAVRASWSRLTPHPPSEPPRLDLGRPKRQPGAVADAPVGDHEPSDLHGQALTDPRRRRARELDLEDLAALLADAEQLDRVQRLAVGVGLRLLREPVQHRLRRHHVDE